MSPCRPICTYAPENPVTGHAFAVHRMDRGRRRCKTCLRRSILTILTTLGTAIGRTLAAIHGFAYDAFRLFRCRPESRRADGSRPRRARRLSSLLSGRRLGRRTAWSTRLPRTSWPLPRARDIGVEEWQRPGLPRPWRSSTCRIFSSARLPRARWEVAALIDWEYAFVGAPGFDFGNLLRPPLAGSAEFFCRLGAGLSGRRRRHPGGLAAHRADHRSVFLCRCPASSGDERRRHRRCQMHHSPADRDMIWKSLGIRTNCFARAFT